MQRIKICIRSMTASEATQVSVESCWTWVRAKHAARWFRLSHTCITKTIQLPERGTFDSLCFFSFHYKLPTWTWLMSLQQWQLDRGPFLSVNWQMSRYGDRVTWGGKWGVRSVSIALCTVKLTQTSLQEKLVDVPRLASEYHLIVITLKSTRCPVCPQLLKILNVYGLDAMTNTYVDPFTQKVWQIDKNRKRVRDAVFYIIDIYW